MVGLRNRGVLSLLVLALVCSAVLPPATASTDARAGGGEPGQQSAAAVHSAAAVQSAAALQSVPTVQSAATLQSASNNSTSHHANPSNASESGDLGQVRGWLAGRLAERLGDSAVEISQGQYESGRSLIGDDYDSRLAELVDVVGETDSSDDDEMGERFSDVRQTQRDLSNTSEEYEETYDAYHEARRNGNESEARRQARRLQELEDEADRLNRSLQSGYDRLENLTGTDLGEAKRSIANLSTNISERQAAVEREVFTATELTVSAESERISYDDPLVATGRLVTADGTPVANREVSLRIYTRTEQVRTDDDGRFSVRYRPRTLPVDATSLSVRYVPTNESAYLGSNESVDVTVEQVEATLSVEATPSTVGYGDRVESRVELTRDGEPVSGVPVESSIGDFQLGERSTDGSGISPLGGTVPARLPVGSAEISAVLTLEDRAVTAERVTAPVTVRSTETTLTVDGAQTDAGRLRVTGQLLTADGAPVTGQSVRVSVGEATGEYVQTEPNGSYVLSLNRSELSALSNATVAITASFDGQGTNLESSSASGRVAYDPADGSGSGTADGVSSDPGAGSGFGGDGFFSPATIAVALAGALVLLLLLGAGYRYYRTGDEDQTAAESTDDSGRDSAETTVEQFDLSQGRDLLAEGRSGAAVRYAYQQVRASVADRAGVDDADTHWEFFEKCTDSELPQEQLSTLRALVETYEHVEFGGQRDAVEAVDRLIEDVEAAWSGEQSSR